jgi:energy-converting hydrogenase Eha subunit G
VIAGSLGGAGVFAAASFCAFGDTALGAASIEWAGIAGLVAGAGWAANATVKLTVAAQPNSKG